MENEICPVGTECLLNRLGYVLDAQRTHWSTSDGMDSVPASLEEPEKKSTVDAPAMLLDRVARVPVWLAKARQELIDSYNELAAHVLPEKYVLPPGFYSGSIPRRDLNCGLWPEKKFTTDGRPIVDVPRGDCSVDVKQFSNETLLKMWRNSRSLSRQVEAYAGSVLQSVPRELYEKAKAAALGIESGAATEGKREILCEYLFEAWKIDKAAVRAMSEREIGDAPRELQQAAGGDMAMQAVPSETARVMTPDQLRHRRNQALSIREFGDQFFERRVS